MNNAGTISDEEDTGHSDTRRCCDASTKILLEMTTGSNVSIRILSNGRSFTRRTSAIMWLTYDEHAQCTKVNCLNILVDLRAHDCADSMPLYLKICKILVSRYLRATAGLLAPACLSSESGLFDYAVRFLPLERPNPHVTSPRASVASSSRAGIPCLDQAPSSITPIFHIAEHSAPDIFVSREPHLAVIIVAHTLLKQA